MESPAGLRGLGTGRRRKGEGRGEGEQKGVGTMNFSYEILRICYSSSGLVTSTIRILKDFSMKFFGLARLGPRNNQLDSGGSGRRKFLKDSFTY